MPDTVILSVYFSGTDHAIDDQQYLASALCHTTKTDWQHLRMGFNGCGVDYGNRGILFGTGLEEQCQQVFNKVIELLKAGKRVKLNAYGHSRGGIACLLLAKMLGKFDRDLVEVNLALMDPVPGNFIASSTIDIAQRTLARQAMDLSECRNLNHVLAIYPSMPLPSYAAHAPLVPSYPTHCEVTEEIIPGCHADAQCVYFHTDQDGEYYLRGQNFQSDISSELVSRFLDRMGTRFKFKLDDDDYLLESYNLSLKELKEKRAALSRACHAQSRVAIKTVLPATYLSPLHESLAKRIGSANAQEIYPQESSCAYFFSRPRSTEKSSPTETMLTIEDKIALFIKFLENIYQSGMSRKSQESLKGSLIKVCIDQLKHCEHDEISLKNVMRNAFALCLQRDRHAYSPSSTTQSGCTAVKLLNSEKYRPLAKMILNADKKKVQYSDLRAFVLGRNDKAYFNAKKSAPMYGFFKPDNKAGDQCKFLDNNMGFYLSR